MKLNIAPQAYQNMQDHAESDYPKECCGFLYGQEEEIRQLQISRRVVNAREGDQRRRFQIDPKDYQEAEEYALIHDLDLLGVYHSHPDHPAVPSEHDREIAMPWFSYLIISVQDGNVTATRSWRLNERHEFGEEPIEITELLTDKPKT
ncbi:M67 family metallopeptidase [Fodinibius sediminis]|uniref:Proteasome lid subunit RPN8/RPN11, contains Jab1/MPN metalloenzyme (JAMM) motif n=1 Tax=Fodinibius sediminis TaxID=1214077 RepID=A0A521BYN7_9BACT|nr:M67 family metallopeptidase [Fodinibius sediminis]SMO52175.1 Proteasome lid subunit RPN8/RPN11, contains Jab1/MPN metalloenzyme (JAMM) motif [Fodinibius sediminis]